LQDVQLAGTQLSFKAPLPDELGRGVVHEFSARVVGDSMEGSVKAGPDGRAFALKARRAGGKAPIGPDVDPNLAVLKGASGAQ
jgi:hypothetical protein